MKHRVNLFRARRGVSLIVAGLFLLNHQGVLSNNISLNPGLQAAGNSSTGSGYTLVSEGKPVLWKSCSTIRYVVSADTSPKELSTLKKALSIESKLSGHEFEYLGMVQDKASNNWASTKFAGYSYPPVLISWTEGKSDLLSDYSAGGTLANPTQGINPELVTGSIAFNRSIYQTLNEGFGKGNTQGNLILHEVGHLLGLSHRDNPSELMYPQISEKTHNGYTSAEANLLSNSCK